MKTKTRTFQTKDGLELIVKSRKSAVIFEIEESEPSKIYKFNFLFTKETFTELVEYIREVSNESWANLTPKLATSMGADYDEYYDRELDNNGYLSILENGLYIKRPMYESGKMYQFNKPKMQSFLYDLEKIV